MSLGDALTDNGVPPPPPAPIDHENGDHAGLTNSSANDDDPQVRDVLASEMGISTMLGRLKQSIASAKDFATFLKRRAGLEDEHAQGIKKLCRHSQDSSQKGEHRAGSFAKAYDDMMVIHERMSENGVQFAASLMQMHEDLHELAAMAEKSRKGWKQSGLAAEQRVVELETAMRKSKSRYDSLAEDYERVRTGDVGGAKSGKVFGIRGPKSAEQHEQDLLRKVQAADQDYHGKVQTYQAERSELLSRTRPETVKALRDVVRECDSAVVLQMQKFASFNEKLLLSNGLCVSPLKGQPGDSRSMRDCIAAINNDRDLKDYVTSYHRNLPPKGPEPKYERNPVLDSQGRPPTSPTSPSGLPGQGQGQGQGQSAYHSMSGSMSQLPSLNNRASISGYVESPISPPGQAPTGHNYHPSASSISVMQSGQNPGPQPFQHERSFSIGSLTPRRNDPSPPAGQQSFVSRGGPTSQPLPPPSQNPRFNGPSSGPPSNFSSSQGGPPQLGVLPFQPASAPPPQQAPQLPPLQTMQQPQQYGAPNNHVTNQFSSPPGTGQQQQSNLPRPGYASQGRQQSPQGEPPRRPVFGLTLQQLYDRDQLAVPMVVYQCIQAVDLYGLEVEGIYRLSGSLPSVNKLKAMFNQDSSSPDLDFRNPENFFQDVNSVAGLLKQFFRDLPDPLLTKECYQDFIDAAKTSPDDIARRDRMHAIINSLPDPNYATLRALTLHLYRVMDKSNVTRMTPQNLAIVFGPTLMGTDSNLADSGFQSKVVETILLNTYQIFDDD